MPGTQCVFNTDSLPAEVRRGDTLTADVTVVSCAMPIRSVVIEAGDYGISQRLRKLDERTFRLELKVPFLVPPGVYRYALWAVGENGEKSARQPGTVTIR